MRSTRNYKLFTPVNLQHQVFVALCVRETDRDRQRQTETDRDRQRHTETERQIYMYQSDGETQREVVIDTKTEIQRYRKTGTET